MHANIMVLVLGLWNVFMFKIIFVLMPEVCVCLFFFDFAILINLKIQLTLN